MLDQIHLNFNPQSLMVLNVVLGLVMFGVALDLKVEDFRRVFEQPRAIGVGLLGQLVLLPAVTWVLVWLWKPEPSIALGMFLVAACPGGNISNFITHIARGNTSLSVSMTAVVSLAAVVLTPWNFSFWAGLLPETAQALKSVHVDFWQVFQAVLLLLLLPLTLGMIISARSQRLVERIRQPFRIFSLVAFAAFVVLALLNNWKHFISSLELVFVIVLVHNGLAFLTGYTAARIGGLKPADRRAVTIEVGIQNSGLGLVLIFNFFGGKGGMAIIAAWWGVWHILAGLTLARFWSQDPNGAEPEPKVAD
ncbi:MAG: bile acid:sodium symporter family protein [Myxococcales bacterium]|nr:bile acid:sodium symporter family protein [Myxococcales bacterium]MCB9642667.1 bile acid:sodium symporter family protein [Myxococcales bacterium]